MLLLFANFVFFYFFVPLFIPSEASKYVYAYTAYMSHYMIVSSYLIAFLVELF